MKIKESHNDNVHAIDLKGVIKHISEVESGKNGYYCRSCGAELVARKGEIRSHYFAHVSTDLNIERKCTYSNETYRHKIAKEILQRIKKIKVPILYKFPPAGISGWAMKLREAETIEAFSVKNERQFYEDENGNIKHGKNIDFKKNEKKHLLIQPDVTFFDKDNKPILLIEVVATHGIDPGKLAKIKRLGIDTIQVSIPKDCEEEIENCFYRTNRTKWIFNYEHETTPFLSVPKGNTEGILPFDEFERKLSGAAESFACRNSQIGNLIRGLRKCLGSEPYRRIEQKIGEELARVAKNSERNRERLYDLRAEHRAAVEKRFERAEADLRKEEEEFIRAERAFQEKNADLERRYFTKREELANAQGEYQPESQSEIERIERYLEERRGTKDSFAEQIRALEREEEALDKEVRLEDERIAEEKAREEEFISDLEKRRSDFPAKFDKDVRELRERFESNERRIRRAIEDSKRETIEAIQDGDRWQTPEDRRRIKKAISFGELLLPITEGQSRVRRLREIKRIYDSGAYKSWD